MNQMLMIKFRSIFEHPYAAPLTIYCKTGYSAVSIPKVNWVWGIQQQDPQACPDRPSGGGGTKP